MRVRRGKITLTNTCPLDNIIYILVYIFREHTSVLKEYPECKITGLLLEIIKHCNTGDWSAAKAV